MKVYYLKRDDEGNLVVVSGRKHNQVGRVVFIDNGEEMTRRAESVVFDTREDAEQAIVEGIKIV